MTKTELDDLERLIKKHGAPLSPMLIFSLIDHLREANARIAELEADLSAAEDGRDSRETYAALKRAATAEARLAAVIAKFDGHHMFRGQCIGCVRRFGGIHYECDLTDIRAAATS